MNSIQVKDKLKNIRSLLMFKINKIKSLKNA